MGLGVPDDTSANLRTMPDAVKKFGATVGSEGPVMVLGGGTHAAHMPLASVQAAARTDEVAQVRAPAGIWEYTPSEMTVRCGAGTTLAELDAALTPHGQMVPFDASPQATVGGVLATGLSGHRRLRYGHVRDLVLQTRHIDHNGQVVTAGGPTVKNVSGYDLCRLLVGSFGTLGFFAEVILRCLPIPAVSQWLVGQSDPFQVFDVLYRPASILWDGTSTWMLLEGHPDDVASETAKLAQMQLAMQPTEQPAALGEWLSGAKRASLRPSQLRQLAQSASPSGANNSPAASSTPVWLAEVGVGVVHYQGDNPTLAANASSVSPAVSPANPAATNAALAQAIKRRLDPSGRLNPGLQPW